MSLYIQVVDAFDPELHDQAASLPRLVYHETTMQMVNAVLALVEAKVVDPAKCCAVFQEAHGIDGLLGLQSLTEHRFNIICTAVLYVGEQEVVSMHAVWTAASLFYSQHIKTNRTWLHTGISFLHKNEDGACRRVKH